MPMVMSLCFSLCYGRVIIRHERFSMPVSWYRCCGYCSWSVCWHIDIVSVESDSGLAFEYFFTMAESRAISRHICEKCWPESRDTWSVRQAYGTKFLLLTRLVSDESLKVVSSYHCMIYVTNCITSTRVNFHSDYRSNPRTRTLKPSM